MSARGSGGRTQGNTVKEAAQRGNKGKPIVRLSKRKGEAPISTPRLFHAVARYQMKRGVMAKKGKGSGSGKYRSAVSGRYVTAKHGKRSPKTTVKESK